jgi:hypothetical protein
VSGKTAGQQAYEAGGGGIYGFSDSRQRLAYEDLDPLARKGFEAAAAAVETGQLRLAREDRDSLKRRVLDLAGELDGRCATRPPGQSHTEHEIAIALRKLLDDQ